MTLKRFNLDDPIQHEEDKAEQKLWAVEQGLDISHWTDDMTAVDMQIDRYRQLQKIEEVGLKNA
jgi:hypothetical protein